METDWEMETEEEAVRVAVEELVIDQLTIPFGRLVKGAVIDVERQTFAQTFFGEQ